jgi:ribulose bisphosphate carboxylase small subunit
MAPLLLNRQSGCRPATVLNIERYEVDLESYPQSPPLLALWDELLDLCAPAAVDVLAHLRAHPMEYNATEPTSYQRLLAVWPDQMRQLIEWAVRNPDQVVAAFDLGPAHDRVGAARWGPIC